MELTHAALYTWNLEQLRDFYIKYFGGRAGSMYENPKTGFRSYFVRFDSGTALEIMTRATGLREDTRDELRLGFSHIAFAAKNPAAVDRLTERLCGDGYERMGGPRVTGDGYYESCFLDPDGNRVEITCPARTMPVGQPENVNS